MDMKQDGPPIWRIRRVFGPFGRSMSSISGIGVFDEEFMLLFCLFIPPDEDKVEIYVYDL